MWGQFHSKQVYVARNTSLDCNFPTQKRTTRDARECDKVCSDCCARMLQADQLQKVGRRLASLAVLFSVHRVQCRESSVSVPNQFIHVANHEFPLTFRKSFRIFGFWRADFMFTKWAQISAMLKHLQVQAACVSLRSCQGLNDKRSDVHVDACFLVYCGPDSVH